MMVGLGLHELGIGRLGGRKEGRREEKYWQKSNFASHIGWGEGKWNSGKERQK